MSAFASNNEKNTDDTEILKQVIEILKKDCFKIKENLV